MRDLQFEFESAPVAIEFFPTESEPVTKLYVEDGELRFTGNMDAAAKIFFDQCLKPMCDNYIKEQLGRGIYTCQE